MNYRFGIAVGPIPVPLRLQLRAQFRVIIDFSVEYDPGGLVFIADRLLPGGKIDDTQAPHAQADGTGDVKPIIIRPAVRHDLPHLAQSVTIDLRFSTELHQPGNTTHTRCSFSKVRLQHCPPVMPVETSSALANRKWRESPACRKRPSPG